MIKWQDSYSVGIAELDEQHKSLFQFCNDIEDALKDKEISSLLLVSYLGFLKKYVANHFGQEETCMHKYACPIAQTNANAHQNFIRAYGTFEESINKGASSYQTLKELHRFLEDWLVAHICSIDIQLRSCVHK
jgi:hemerythrin